MKRRVSFALSAVVTILLASVAPSALAGIYVFGSHGFSTHEFLQSETGTAYKVGVGLAAPGGQGGTIGIEASYVDLGDAYQPTAPAGYLGIWGTNVSVSSEVVIRPLVIGGRVGIYDLNASDTGYGFAVSSTGLSWGVSVGYELNKHVTFLLDADQYGNVATPGGSETPTATFLGVRVAF